MWYLDPKTSIHTILARHKRYYYTQEGEALYFLPQPNFHLQHNGLCNILHITLPYIATVTSSQSCNLMQKVRCCLRVGTKDATTSIPTPLSSFYRHIVIVSSYFRTLAMSCVNNMRSNLKSSARLCMASQGIQCVTGRSPRLEF